MINAPVTYVLMSGLNFISNDAIEKLSYDLVAKN